MPDDDSLLSHTVQRLKRNDPGLCDPVIIDTSVERNINIVPLKPEGNRTIEGKFAPGNNANPLGRPKLESTLPSCTRAELERIDPKTGKTNAQIIAEMVVSRAKSGDTKMIEMCLDYVTGKPVQSINTQMLGAVKILVEYKNKVEQHQDGSQS